MIDAYLKCVEPITAVLNNIYFASNNLNSETALFSHSLNWEYGFES